MKKKYKNPDAKTIIDLLHKKDLTAILQSDLKEDENKQYILGLNELSITENKYDVHVYCADQITLTFAHDYIKQQEYKVRYIRCSGRRKTTFYISKEIKS